MNLHKRKKYLILIIVISLLSIYQFLDVYSKFKFMFLDILNNITNYVVIFMLFVLLISFTSFLSIIFNWKLLRKLHSISESNLIDETVVKKPYKLGFLHFAYLAFGGLIAGLGMFLILGPLRENYSLKTSTNGLIPFFISMIIIGLGVLLIFDGIKIQRSIAASNTQAQPENFGDVSKL